MRVEVGGEQVDVVAHGQDAKAVGFKGLKLGLVGSNGGGADAVHIRQIGGNVAGREQLAVVEEGPSHLEIERLVLPGYAVRTPQRLHLTKTIQRECFVA